MYFPRTGDPIEIPAGSMVTSLDKLAHAGEHTKEQARKCLRYLKTAHMIDVEGTHHWTKITVLNWTTYQQVDHRSEHSDGHERGGTESEDEPVGGTHERTHAGTLSKEIKKNSTTLSKSGDLDLLPGIEPNRSAPRSRKEIDPEIRRWFESEFWPAYPRHEAKVKSLLAANEKATTAKKRAFYLDRLKGQLPEYLRRKAESGQRVIPLGATWFNQDRAQDELPLDAASGQNGRCSAPASPEYPNAEDYFRKLEEENYATNQ